MSFAGGAFQDNQSPTVGSKCTWYAGGSSLTKQSSTQWEIGGAVSLSAAIGINIDAQTGWTTAAKLKMTMTHGRYLCGVNDYPGGSPGHIGVKS